jgi:Asp-tRNA(Asn)/Glu-tRNA(Gln) amidotransferase A subunit family amidase
MSNIAFDALSMAACVASGEISARALLESCINRIEATDASVNAFTDKTLSRAFAEADAVDIGRANGQALSTQVTVTKFRYSYSEISMPISKNSPARASQ